MEKDRKALLFSGMALLATLFILLTGPLYVIQNLTFVMVQIFGLLLIIWALITKEVNKSDSVNKLPKGYFFINKGPYEIIRHPMYAGILLFMSSLVQYDFTFLRIWAFLILIIALLLKIVREEHTMEHEVSGYKEYKDKTKRLIPYLF